jgi:hypothetical protein
MKLLLFIISLFCLLGVGFFIRNQINLTRELAPSDLKNLALETKSINDSKIPKVLLIIWPKEILGIERRTGQLVVRVGSCSDLCPQYASVLIIYDGVGQAKCRELNGEIKQGETWENYVGCIVKVGD